MSCEGMNRIPYNVNRIPYNTTMLDVRDEDKEEEDKKNMCDKRLLIMTGYNILGALGE